jgi:hypothetical protein
MSATSDEIRAKIETYQHLRPTPLRVVHKPTDDQGKPSLWPYGVSDGINHGWFEGNKILFWGINKESNILNQLSKMGFRIKDSF